MKTMTDEQVISMSFGTWAVRRLTELRSRLGLPALDATVPYLVAMPAGTDGALMNDGGVAFTLANRHAGPMLDLPVHAEDDLPPLRVGGEIERTEERRMVLLVSCHDTSALLAEASRMTMERGHISEDTHQCLVASSLRLDTPFELAA